MKTYFKNHQKLLFFFLVGLLFIGCNPKNPEPNVKIQWNVILDGQNYSWEGIYPESSTSNLGGCQYSLDGDVGNISMSNTGTSQGLIINLTKSSMNTSGSYDFNQLNYSANSTMTIMNNSNGLTTMSTGFGGNVNLNISTFATNSVSSDGVSISTVLKGSFSGTIGKTSGGTSIITGSFEAIRIH